MPRMRGSIEASQPTDLALHCAFRTKLTQTGSLSRFRKLSAIAIEDEPVMVVTGLRQLQQRLQKPMDRGGVKQVTSAHHIGHVLCCIVDNYRKVIAGRHLLACQNDVAQIAGLATIVPIWPWGLPPVSIQSSVPTRLSAACISRRKA